MKQLQKQFPGKGQVKGYDFKQVTATPHGYIYERTSEEGGTTYEVFKHKENTLHGCVSYPTDKAFGIWAWSAPTINRAEEILAEITAKDLAKIEVVL